MKKNRIIILLLLSLTFAACDNMRPDISITVKSDYNSLIEAVSSSSRSLSEKLKLIEAAVNSGFANEKAVQELLRQALSSLSGTLAQKLESLEAAMGSQTTALETKLGLIEAAVSAGFVDEAARQALIQEALLALGGSLEEKLASVENAISSKTASLEVKLSLIEAAVKEGFADEVAKRELVLTAVQSLTGTVEERLNAIEKAMEGSTASLSAKLNLIEAALKNRLADSSDLIKLISEALSSLTGTAETKLEAIQGAIQEETTALETKLVLIEAAVSGGFADSSAQQELLQQAVLALKGTAEKKLAAIAAAIESQGTSLSLKMDLIETAVKEGFANSNEKAALIQTAVSSLSGNVQEKLSAIGTAVANQTDSLTTKLALIRAALDTKLASSNDALRLLKTALSTSLKDGVEEIVTALGNISETLYPDEQSHNGVVWMLREIESAISNNAKIDYTAILGAIQRSIYFMGHNINGYEYVELGHYEGTGQVLKWATMNIGASRPQETGDYFAWGETEPYYSSLNPLVWKTGKEAGYAVASYGKNITVATLKEQDDAARQHWGASWRTPTEDELTWLSNPEFFEWTPVTSYEGVSVNGMIVKSKENGNSIFLPVTGAFMGTAFGGGTSAWGYYWSSTVIVSEIGKAQGLAFWDDKSSPSKSTLKSHARYWGFAIRPVSY